MLDRLDLSDFRNHRALTVRAAPGFIILHGANGAGKTNILEAVSLLAPGRGLRRAALCDMANSGGSGGFVVSATADGSQFGTAISAQAAGRRQVQVNGTSAPINDLAQWFAILWLTPAMDRLFGDSAGGRRRFLDRLVLALDPAHALHSSRYDNALRQRGRMLAEGQRDPAWFDAIEARLVEHGAAISAARANLITQLSEALSNMPPSPFARPLLALEGSIAVDQERYRANRARDMAAKRTLDGPHRADLVVHHQGHGQPAGHCSTGEQKALLLSIMLAHAALVRESRGKPPILLLDEVAAHLDPDRREALFARLADTGSQIWMTGTEASLFESAGKDALRLQVAGGQLGG